MATQQLCLEGAVETLLLALCLGMIGSAMQDAHTQPQQPDGERRVASAAAAAAPGAAMIAEDRFRQAVALESALQRRLHRRGALVAGRIQHQIIPAVVIEHREGVAALT